MKRTREIIKVARGVSSELAKKFKVSKSCVTQALRGDRLANKSKVIRAAALESHGGKIVIVTEEDK